MVGPGRRAGNAVIRGTTETSLVISAPNLHFQKTTRSPATKIWIQMKMTDVLGRRNRQSQNTSLIRIMTSANTRRVPSHIVKVKTRNQMDITGSPLQRYTMIQIQRTHDESHAIGMNPRTRIRISGKKRARSPRRSITIPTLMKNQPGNGAVVHQTYRRTSRRRRTTMTKTESIQVMRNLDNTFMLSQVNTCKRHQLRLFQRDT